VRVQTTLQVHNTEGFQNGMITAPRFQAGNNVVQNDLYMRERMRKMVPFTMVTLVPEKSLLKDFHIRLPVDM